MEKYNSKIVNLSSKQRKNGSSNNFTLSIPPSAREFNSVVGIQMVSTSIPNTFYNINEYNNFFEYKYSALNTTGIVLLPIGQYEITPLLNAISTQMTTDIGNSNITWSIDTLDFKVNVESDNESLSFTTDDPDKVPLLIALGFEGSVIIGTSLTAKNIVDIAGPSTLYIISRALSGSTSDYSELTNIVRCIGLDVNFGSICHYSVEDSESGIIKFPNSRSMSNIDLSLRDRDNRILDLNGVDWDLLIRVYYL